MRQWRMQTHYARTDVLGSAARKKKRERMLNEEERERSAQRRHRQRRPARFALSLSHCACVRISKYSWDGRLGLIERE